MQLIRNLLYQTLFVAVLLVLTDPKSCSAAKCSGNSHNLITGNELRQQMLLWKEHIKSSWKLFGTAKHTVSYPTKKGDENKYIITLIKVLDRYSNGHGGCPSIQKGGVGHSNVTLLIESEMFRGIEFDVEIYGLKRSKAKKIFKLR